MFNSYQEIKMEKTTDFSLIGFNKYDSMIISVLLKGNVLTVKQVYDMIKVPKNKIYESLEKLAKEGIVCQEKCKPKKYFIVNDRIIDELILKKEEKLLLLKEKVDELKKSKEMLNPSILSIIDGDDEIHKLIEHSNSSIKTEIFSCSRLTKMHYGCFRTLKDAIERGVKVKFISIYNGDNFDVLRKYYNIGVEIRLFDNKKKVFPKIGLFDKKFTRITIWEPDVKDKKDYKTIWANSKILYNIVENHFNKIWEESLIFDPKTFEKKKCMI